MEECGAYMCVENYSMGGEEFTGCYNTVSHSWDTAADQSTCESYDWYVNYGATMFTGCYNMVSHTTDADMTEAECGAFTHFDGFGTTGINGIYDFSNVPVASGSVIVLSVLVFGAVTVSTPVPEACPCIFTFAIMLSPKLNQ